MNPNVIVKMIQDNNSDIILNLFICLQLGEVAVFEALTFNLELNFF
jgi:hypothetical protein